MRISVILPCFNGAETIGVQLDALTRQRWTHDWEVVVVNNGSTDNSMQVVERYRERLPNLRIVQAHVPSEPRRGVTHSYAVGFAAATGDAFALCEADDQVGEGWLMTLGNALREHELVAVALEYELLNPPAIVATGHGQQSAESGLATNSLPMLVPYASGCSLGLRRSVYERLGNPDERCAAAWDKDYCWRAYLAGIPLHFEPSAVVHFRLRTTLRGAYHQGRGWGSAYVTLDQKYRGVQTGSEVVERHARGIFNVVKHVAKGARVLTGQWSPNFWVWSMGWCVGIVQGELNRSLGTTTMIPKPQTPHVVTSLANTPVFASMPSASVSHVHTSGESAERSPSKSAAHG